jgi:hypothetical protein
MLNGQGICQRLIKLYDDNSLLTRLWEIAFALSLSV